MAPERQEPESSENIAKGLTQKRQQARYTAKGDLKQEEKADAEKATERGDLLATPVCIEVRLQRVHVGALKWRWPAWRSSTPHPKCPSLGARDTDA